MNWHTYYRRLTGFLEHAHLSIGDGNLTARSQCERLFPTSSTVLKIYMIMNVIISWLPVLHPTACTWKRCLRLIWCRWLLINIMCVFIYVKNKTKKKKPPPAFKQHQATEPVTSPWYQGEHRQMCRPNEALMSGALQMWNICVLHRIIVRTLSKISPAKVHSSNTHTQTHQQACVWDMTVLATEILRGVKECRVSLAHHSSCYTPNILFRAWL